MAKVNLSGIDYSNEGTTVGFYAADLTAANFVAQGVIMENLRTAIQAVSLITFDGGSYPAYVTPAGATLPTDPNAQRESKWQVNYVDTVTGDKGRFEIGGADLSLLIQGTQFMNTAAGAGADLVSAVNTNVRSKAGNPVEVSTVKHVGRAS